jgi:hypothetical protein
MENTTKITIEDLAVKLNGKMWTKDSLKRIYLDRGYNTKKMSTKTYVEETSEGNFNVKCFVECPSQDYNWCKSQANQVIDSVENQINEILKEEIENPKVNIEELIEEAVKQSGNSKQVISEIIFKMVSKFDTDTYGILSKINGFALYICYNYNGHHPITVVMNDRTHEIGYLHHSGGFLTFIGDDWIGTDTHTHIAVIPQDYFHSND